MAIIKHVPKEVSVEQKAEISPKLENQRKIRRSESW